MNWLAKQLAYRAALALIDATEPLWITDRVRARRAIRWYRVNVEFIGRLPWLEISAAREEVPA